MKDTKTSDQATVSAASGAKRSSGLTNTAKKRIILLVAALFAAIAVGAFFVLRTHHPKVFDKNCQHYIDETAKNMEKKDYPTVVNMANLYQAKNCTNQQKAALLGQKGLAQFFQNKLDEAEKTLKEAQVLNDGKLDSANAFALAGISYKKGNKQEAIKYYKLLIQAIKETPENADDGYIPQYKSIIRSLGGTP